MTQDFAITLDWRRGYEFSVEFGQEGVGPLVTDEPPPLGEGVGPNPARLLAAAVGNCMSASLKYCLDRARIELEALTTTVEGTIVRTDQGRLRIGSLRVRLEPIVGADDRDRMGRCLEAFEDFCIVGQSVRQGIDIAVDLAVETAPAVPVATAVDGEIAPASAGEPHVAPAIDA